jgi:hypothetical protein
MHLPTVLLNYPHSTNNVVQNPHIPLDQHSSQLAKTQSLVSLAPDTADAPLRADQTVIRKAQPPYTFHSSTDKLDADT